MHRPLGLKPPQELAHRRKVSTLWLRNRRCSETVRRRTGRSASRSLALLPLPHWSVVIANNASTDSTLAVAEGLDTTYRRVSVLHLDQKGGRRTCKGLLRIWPRCTRRWFPEPTESWSHHAQAGASGTRRRAVAEVVLVPTADGRSLMLYNGFAAVLSHTV